MMIVGRRGELLAFSITLLILVGGFFGDSLFGGRVLSSADVLFASGSFEDVSRLAYEPHNRLLMDPVLQFQPWLEFSRSMIRSGRLPLWNTFSGCGAPHLANGQSAVFDPFQLIAYLGDLPTALGWMSAGRLWFAGLGMFLLARAWGFGGWGRWFAGLTFPFCGFLVVWLLYPVTNVAVWLPWVLLATDRAWNRPGVRSVGCLAMAVGGLLLGGHVQTSAHVLLASGAYACWRAWQDRFHGFGLITWALGVVLGLGVASIEVVPLGAYLSKSPVWGDRERERTSSWRLTRPRILDAGCTALPYLYGSQRRGQPNLARALRVHNLNESAGGFAGLATLVWLAPLGGWAWRSQPRVRFLVGLTVFGFLGAFRLPPVDNLLRALPVLGVTDNRRLTLWLAFGLVCLGGIGLDRLRATRESVNWRRWATVWLVASVALLVGARGVVWQAPMIRERALAHYTAAMERTPGADPAVYRERAERQVRETLDFVPRYLALAALQFFGLGCLSLAVGSRRIGDHPAKALLLGLTLVDLFGFGHGLNPSIPRTDDRPVPLVIARLRRQVGGSGRIIGLGAELPPNVLMRYGLADARNYDSIELSRSLDWFEPLYDPRVLEKTSRREITWSRVLGASDRLSQASVRAVVAPLAPPEGIGLDSEAVGSVWVAWLKARPIVELEGSGTLESVANHSGRVEAQVTSTKTTRLIVRETYDPGWRAEVDGVSHPVEQFVNTFLKVSIPPGNHQVVLVYDPLEVRVGGWISIIALVIALFTLTDFGLFRFTRIVRTRLGRTQALGLESDS